jgi:hypothetical protein
MAIAEAPSGKRRADHSAVRKINAMITTATCPSVSMTSVGGRRPLTGSDGKT